MLELSIRQAAEAMHARLGNGPSDDPALGHPFPPVSIDSRTLRQGEAYFAILGERHDGHAYLDSAARAGASLLVVDRTPAVPCLPGIPILQVEDTTRALQDLARHLRRLWNRRLVAVTGSMGKTTTREFTAALLAERLAVLQPKGNFNNHIGLPLSLTRLEASHEAAVVELGMNHPGEIRRLGDICRPDVALMTNVSAVHLEFFDSVDAIARAKGEILESIRPGGCFVYNADDPRVRSLADAFEGSKVSFGFGDEADYRISKWAIEDFSGVSFRLVGPRLEVNAKLCVVGKHFLYNAAAAIAVASLFELTEEEIDRGLTRLAAVGGRGTLTRLGNITLWDDSYNSNPGAVESVLETIGSLDAVARRVLVLGDMLELGPRGPELHRQVGMRAGTMADLLVTVGTLAESLRAGAIQAGLQEDRALHFASAEEAADALPAMLQDGDLVVVKASRGVHLERVVEAISGGRH